LAKAASKKKNWKDAVSLLEEYVVRIETPNGTYGTGFLCPRPENNSFLGIATARHVVQDADYWQQPIKVYHRESEGPILLRDSDRVVLHDNNGLDSSLLVIPPDKLEFPEEPIGLLPDAFPVPVGIDIGWVGFPQMYPNTQCFFSGRVSAVLGDRHTYLLDGVVVNGVSGGPVIYPSPSGKVYVVWLRYRVYSEPPAGCYAARPCGSC